MTERQLPTQEQRSAFFGKVPELIEQNEVFGQRAIVGLNSLDLRW